MKKHLEVNQQTENIKFLHVIRFIRKETEIHL